MTAPDEPLAPDPEPLVFRLEPTEPLQPPATPEPPVAPEALAPPEPPAAPVLDDAADAEVVTGDASPTLASKQKRTAPWPALLTAVSLMVIAALVVVVPLQASSTFVTDVTQLTAFCLVFAGLWLLTHRMGLLSVGHGALTGVGAYAALHAVNDFGLPPMLMPLEIASMKPIGLPSGIRNRSSPAAAGAVSRPS